ISFQMSEGRGRFIRDPVSFNRKIREKMARPNLTKFRKPVSWNNGKPATKFSRLPQDCLLHIFTYLDWQDLESMKRVSQTMHSLANFTMDKSLRRVDSLCISQYCLGWAAPGDAFELYSRDCSQQRYTYYLEAAKVGMGQGHSSEHRWRAKGKKLMDVSELFEFRHIYKGVGEYSKLFEYNSLPAPNQNPASIFYTRLEHASRGAAFAELRLVNVLLESNYLQQIGRALEGKTPQTIHFKRITRTNVDADDKMVAEFVHILRPQSLILSGCDPSDAWSLFNESFLDNFVSTGWAHYSLSVQSERIQNTVLNAVVAPSETFMLRVISRFATFIWTSYIFRAHHLTDLILARLKLKVSGNWKFTVDRVIDPSKIKRRAVRTREFECSVVEDGKAAFTISRNDCSCCTGRMSCSWTASVAHLSPETNQEVVVTFDNIARP
ncbi:hypothetical protein PFISCL1PPCAC_18219, partial [Pristionchus fissidentatus]